MFSFDSGNRKQANPRRPEGSEWFLMKKQYVFCDFLRSQVAAFLINFLIHFLGRPVSIALVWSGRKIKKHGPFSPNRAETLDLHSDCYSQSHFIPSSYPFPLFLRVILPLEMESQGVVVESFPYELGQPFNKPLHHQ